MSLRMCVLASGSTGNVTAVWSETTGILIDCGLSRKYIEESLRTIDFDVRKLKGILITHGHGDHVGPSMISMAKMYAAPVYIHKETFDVVCRKPDCRRVLLLDAGLVQHHQEAPFRIGEFEVQPFPSFHSGGCAGKPYGFTLSCPSPRGPQKIGFLTDTGKVDEHILDSLRDCTALVLEANHDPELLKKSSRHYANKRWVLSDSGHLSNDEHARALISIRQRSQLPLSHVFIAHMSKEHNTLHIAVEHITKKLAEHDIKEVQLIPTWHKKNSRVIQI